METAILTNGREEILFFNHSDTGNLSKGCLDALQKIIYKNDSQIKKLSVIVYEKSQEEKLEINIKES